MDVNRTYTLLLVDDNPTNLLLLVKIIELDLPKIRVLTASSGAEGLELAAKEPIDGAFIDVQMPHMSGLEMCRKLNEDPRTAGLPLVLMTAHLAEPELRAEGLEVGAYDFITQPISNVEMLARIKVMLRMCDNERRLQEQNDSDRQTAEEQSRVRRWVSGLLMAGDGVDREPSEELISTLAALIPERKAENKTHLFDCLTTDFPDAWKQTFLKLSLLDAVPLKLAKRLSDLNDVEAAFEYFHRHDLALVQEGDNGELRLSFTDDVRGFLRSKAGQELDSTGCSQVFLLAADDYCQRGEYVAACDCLLRGKQYQAISQLLSQYGLTLFDATDILELMRVFSGIPDEEVARCGWMSLFRGVFELQTMSADTGIWLELSYQLFEGSQQERGQLLSLVYQVYLTLCVDGNYERWSERWPLMVRLFDAQKTLLEPGERIRVLTACGQISLYFAGDIDDVEEMVEQALSEGQREQLTRPLIDVHALKFSLEVYRGRLLVAKAAVEQGFGMLGQIVVDIRRSVLRLIACEQLHAEGDLDGFRQQRLVLDRKPEQGLFIPLLNYYEAQLLLAHGCESDALELLEVARMNPSASIDLGAGSRLLQLRAYCHARKGHHELAQQDMEEALQQREVAGGVLMRLENLLLAGMTCIELEHYDQAAQYLNEGLAHSSRIGELRSRIGLHAWLMVLAEVQGQSDERKTHLNAFLRLLKQQKSYFFWGLTAGLLDRLRLLKGDGLREVLRPMFSLFRSQSISPKGDAVPLLRIYTLGTFQAWVQEDNFDLGQVGFASRQIFALLVVSQNNTMSLETLMGRLWPESSSSRARNSFDAAHSRLRKSLEEAFGTSVRKHYLVLEKGMLSLKNIWIDSSEVERLLSQAHYALRRGYKWQAEVALWKVEALWKGDLLSAYEVDEDVWNTREELRNKHLNALETLARLLTRGRRWADATRLLQQGLALDMTRDSMVRRLLDIYQEEKNRRAALELIDHYRESLVKEDYDAAEIDELIDALGAHWLVPGQHGSH